MLPVEPRLKPLSATILHFADDGEAKTEFKRSHSYSGYIPYSLSDAANDGKSECSVEESFETTRNNVVWPGTDDEDEAPPRQSTAAKAAATESTGAEPTSTTTSVGEKVIVGFGRALRKAVRDMDGMASAYHSFFDGGSAMDLDDFIWALHQNAGAPPVCFVYAFVYICRMSETQMEELSERTVHRLLLAAVTIAAKMQQPQSFDAHLYAQAGHVTAEELQHLEAKLLELLQWNVEVCHKSFRRIFRLLSQAAA
mmetsp:Transcript_3926/g.4487  ORF Transcript_3926/g.4487 Transcript_3926/m.4487 type:complete len:254 (-) Transcript_3926:33-794(-)